MNPFKDTPSRCRPTATLPPWAAVVTTAGMGLSGSSSAAMACGCSKAASWSAPPRLELLATAQDKALQSRYPAMATP